MLQALGCLTSQLCVRLFRSYLRVRVPVKGVCAFDYLGAIFGTELKERHLYCPGPGFAGNFSSTYSFSYLFWPLELRTRKPFDVAIK
jgi:hypothetical protein